MTDALHSRASGQDLEDLEFAAFSDAVAASAAARSAAGDRRVVASADADPAWVDWLTAGDGVPVSRVRLVAAVPMSRIASFHVDEAAGAAIDAKVDGLLWYDATELEQVRALLT